MGKLLDIATLEEQAALTVFDQFRCTANAGTDETTAAGHRFQYCVRESFGRGAGNKYVHCTQERSDAGDGRQKGAVAFNL